MAFLGQEEQIREFQSKFKNLYSIVVVVFVLLFSRLFYLQLVQGEKMRLFSDENRMKRVKIVAPRGMIFDRNRILLIDNRPAFDLEVIPQYMGALAQQEEILKLLAKILKWSIEIQQQMLQRIRNSPSFMSVKLKSDLTRDEVSQIEVHKLDMPGVEIREEIKRTNVYKDIGAHLLGYVGEVQQHELAALIQQGQRYRLGDNIGRFGLEQRMEQVLRGFNGEELREVDALGRIKRQKGKLHVLGKVKARSAIPGKNLILTIDQELQQVASDAFGDKIGAVVGLDPKTGEVLVMLSKPSFDPTAFSRGIPLSVWNGLITNENHPLRDKTIQDHYAPGSTFKVISAIAGLEEEVIDENTVFHCPGKIKIGNRVYHCHSRHGHGDVNVVKALMQSCDIFFYRTALKLASVDVLARWSSAFGLGRKTGISLSAEVPGLIPTEAWKQKKYHQAWSAGETATVAIGQSFVLTTALQLANMYAVLANGGRLLKPYVVKRIESYDGQVLESFDPYQMSRVDVKPKTLQLIHQGLWGAMNAPIGTGYSQRLVGMNFVGKTGTTQVIRLSAEKLFQRCELKKFKDRHNAMFVGYAPLEDPKIVVAVIGEHACHGSTEAAPIAKAIIKKYLQKIDPIKYADPVLVESDPPFRLDKQWVRPMLKDTEGEVVALPEADQGWFKEAIVDVPVPQPPLGVQKTE